MIAVFGVIGAGTLSVVGAVLWTMKNSPANRVSEAFLRDSPEIRALVGDDMRFGWFPRGSIDGRLDEGHAELRIQVRGPAGRAEVDVVSRTSRAEWQVVSASYRDHSGQRRVVLPRSALPSDPGAGEAARLARVRLAEGYRLYRRDEYEAAIREFDEAERLEPGNWETYYWRGVARVKHGDDPHALADLNRARELNPDEVRIYEYLDWTLSRRKDFEGVAGVWSKLIERQPSNARAWYGRGGAYLRMGDGARAASDAEKACKLGFEKACRVARK